MKPLTSIINQLEKTFQQWDHGRISNQTFRDQEVANLKLLYTLHQILENSSPRDLDLQAVLQELQSQQELR